MIKEVRRRGCDGVVRGLIDKSESKKLMVLFMPMTVTGLSLS